MQLWFIIRLAARAPRRRRPVSSTLGLTNTPSAMGIEYTLRFNATELSAVEELLRRIEGASAVKHPSSIIEFRQDAANTEDMPDATAQVQNEGLYFCDHGGFGRTYLGHVVARLVGAYGVVTVEELE